MGVESLPNIIPRLFLRDGLYFCPPFKYVGSEPSEKKDRIAQLTALCAPAAAAPEFRRMKANCTAYEMSMLLWSKYFIYRLGHNGPISSPRFITSFVATDDIKTRLIKVAKLIEGHETSDDDLKIFFNRLQDKLAVLIPDKGKHPDFLEDHFSLRDKYVKQILGDKWNNRKLTFKPNFGANGAGVTHMDIKPVHIEFSVFDGYRSNAKCLPAYFQMYPFDFSPNIDGRLIKFRMYRNARSEQHLNFILDMMSISDCGDMSTIEHPRHCPKFILDSGMLQYCEDLLKDEQDHVIEGRYRFHFDEKGEFHLEKELSEDFSQGSHLKIGTNGGFVNRGEDGRPWATMHELLLKLLNSPINKESYDEYMEALIKSQALHYFTGLKNLGFQAAKEGFHGEIDIAWDATNKELVQTANGTTIQVPKPILMEAKIGFDKASIQPFNFGFNQLN